MYRLRISFSSELIGIETFAPVLRWRISTVMNSFKIDDPDAFTGPEAQVMEEFRRVRDEIRSEMSKL